MTSNTDCWLWARFKNENGYGRFRRGGLAHRELYKLWVGEIPDGLFVLHKCDTPPCINPEHLFLGTALDNSKDMIAKGRGNWNMGEHQLVKTHCPKGHEYTTDNTYIRPNTKRRECRKCSKQRNHHAKLESAQ